MYTLVGEPCVLGFSGGAKDVGGIEDGRVEGAGGVGADDCALSFIGGAGLFGLDAAWSSLAAALLLLLLPLLWLWLLLSVPPAW